jgi:hypothetical protein
VITRRALFGFIGALPIVGKLAAFRDNPIRLAFPSLPSGAPWSHRRHYGGTLTATLIQTRNAEHERSEQFRELCCAFKRIQDEFYPGEKG